MNEHTQRDPRLLAIPDTHGHAKGEHKPYAEERPLPLTARMLFLWFYHACRRGYPRFLMVADHMNYLTFEDPAAVNLVRRALKLAQAGDLYGAAETANVDVAHAAVVSEGLRRGMRYSIGAEVDNDPRSRPDAQNIVDAMRPDAMIRSVHFIPIAHPVHGEGWHWPFDNPEFKDLFDVVGIEQTWELYITALVDAIERLPGHIVGHFFVPAIFGHWPDDAKLSSYEDRVLAAAATRQIAVEFNTRFLYRDDTDEQKQRYLEANKRFLRKAKERGVGIAIGSDAHSPKDQAGAFDIVLRVLDELDINEIVFPLGGMLRRVALRVERKPEPEPVPELPPEPAKRAAERAPSAAEDASAAAPAAPVRKARPGAKATRAPETSPERPRERPETASAPESPAAPHDPAPLADSPSDVAAPGGAPPPAAPQPASAPLADLAGADEPATSPPAPRPMLPAPRTATPAQRRGHNGDTKATPPAKDAAPAGRAPSAAKAGPAKRPVARPAATAAKSSAAAVVKAAAAVVKAVADKARGGHKAPAAKTPVARSASAAKPATAKLVAAKGTAAKGGAAKPAAAKAAGTKSPAKKSSVKHGTAKAPLAKAHAKKSAPAKKTTAKKAPVSRATAKKTVPKKAAAKKSMPARPAPSRKAPTAKKTTAKKTATKRR